MSELMNAMQSGKFVVTTELTPPKGTDLQPLLDKADMLRGMVDGINLTDSHRACMAMSPLSVAHLLLDRGVEPILQLTCRDRNRIALQSDLLAAYALGVSNLVCMTGDDPSKGDHPDAKAVFDIDAIDLLRTISSLTSGKDLAGNDLKGSPSFVVGAVVNPGASDLDKEIRRMEDKIESGACFFQTQTVYDPGSFQKFMDRVQKYNVSIIVGFIMLNSARMAHTFNDNLPGVSVPDEIIRQLDQSADQRSTSIEIAGRILEQLKPMCDGVHIMAAGREKRIPHVLQAAGIIPSITKSSG